MMNGTLLLISVVGAGLSLFPGPAYAYLDPGSSSVILQIIFGGLAGLAMIFKLYWRRIKSGLSALFGLKGGAPKDPP